MVDTVDDSISRNLGTGPARKSAVHIEGVDDLVRDRAGGDFAWPANDEGYAQASFQAREVGAAPRTRPPVVAREHLGAVV